MKKKIITGAGALSLLTPAFALAQGTITSVLDDVGGIFDTIIPLIFAVAIIYFLWGLTKFITTAGGDAEAHESGRNIMIWGVIAIFVMASVWGLVKILQNTFSVDDNTSVDVPQIPTRN